MDRLTQVELAFVLDLRQMPIAERRHNEIPVRQCGTK